MATKISDSEMTSDQTRHTARAWPVPGEPTLWSVTWLPGRALTRNQAVTAMTIAEMVMERAHILADPQSKLWWHMDGWAEELGITGPQAAAEASLSPEDHESMPRVRTLAFDSQPGRTGYLLGLDRSTGTARVRINGETVTMPASDLQYDSGDPEPSRPAAAGHHASAAAGLLAWTMSADGSTWRTQLPDGRTAVIDRLDDGASFLPKVHESRTDVATGPVCAGLPDAAAWAAEYAEASR